MMSEEDVSPKLYFIKWFIFVYTQLQGNLKKFRNSFWLKFYFIKWFFLEYSITCQFKSLIILIIIHIQNDFGSNFMPMHSYGCVHRSLMYYIRYEIYNVFKKHQLSKSKKIIFATISRKPQRGDGISQQLFVLKLY